MFNQGDLFTPQDERRFVYPAQVSLRFDETFEALKGAELATKCFNTIGEVKSYGFKGTQAAKKLKRYYGFCREIALAKWFGWEWKGETWYGHDVGPHECRGTDYHNGRLVLHHEDHDDCRYYLVTGEHLEYTIQGWLLAKDGKQERFWCDPTGQNRWCFMVPQYLLNRWE